MKFLKRFIKSIVFLLLFLIVITVVLFVFRNQITTFVIEKVGSKINGAKVEVSDVNLKPFELHISWNRLQVTDRKDTWKNLFETGKCEFFLTFKPLLAKKFIIENMEISDIVFDSKRETDGKLPVQTKKPKKDKKPSKLMLMVKKNLEAEKKKIPVFNPKQLQRSIDVDSLLADLNFQTPQKVDSLKTIAEERYSFWEDKIENNTYEKDINEIKRNVEKIKPKNIDNILELERQLTAAKTAYTKSDKLWKNFKKDKSELETDLIMLKDLKKDVPHWIRSDYQNALALAKLPDFAVENIALMLFGDRITEGLLTAIDAIEKSREVAQSGEKTQLQQTESEPKPEKMPHLPSLWIKQVNLSLTTKDDTRFEGKALNISNNQKKTQEPMEFIFAGKKEKLGDLDLHAIFDYRHTQSKEKIDLSITDVPVRELKLAKFELLPTRLKRGEAKLESEILFTEREITSKINFLMDKVQFDYTTQPKMNKDLTRIARSITEAIDKITFDASMRQDERRFKFKVDSNLDNLIAQQMKKVISDEIARAKAKLRQKVEKELQKYQQELDKLIAEKEKELQKEIAKLDKKVKEQFQVIEDKKKEIEDKIAKEKKKIEDKINKEIEEQQDKINDEIDKQKDKLEDELEDKLKDLWG